MEQNIGFNNGTYNLTTMTFSNEKSDKTTGYDYEEFDENNVIIKDIYNFFKEIQPITSNMEFLLKSIANYLVIGKENDCKLSLWIGTGYNGKSVLLELIKHTFGEYFSFVEFCNYRNGTERKTLYKKKYKQRNILSIFEPDFGYSCDNIFFNNIKDNLIMCCNHYPIYNEYLNDEKMKQKIQIIPFETSFVEIPKNSNEYKRCNDIYEKNKEWKSAFMWLLIHKYFSNN